MSCVGARSWGSPTSQQDTTRKKPTTDNSDLSSFIIENSNFKFEFEMIQIQCQNLQCSSESHLAVSDSLRPHGVYSPWNSPGQNTGMGAFPFSTGSSQPRDQPRSPTLQVDSLLAEPPGKRKNAGVGSLSLLQQIFPTQESNRGLPHCRWVLYQLSYQGSP